MGTSFSGNLVLSVPDSPLDMKIPISLHPATDNPSKGGVSFKTMCPECDTKVEWQGYKCPECGKEINHYSKGNAGYKVDDEYFVLDRSEIKAKKKERTKNIDIIGFVHDELVNDRKKAGKIYLASPQEGDEKRYQLLSERLGDRWGLAKFVFSSREVLLGFTSEYVEELGRNVLLFRQLMYEEQVRNMPKKLKEADWVNLNDDEREYAEVMISKFTIEPNWEEITDEYKEAVEDLIERKVAGEPITKETETEEEEDEEEDDLELMKAMAEA